MAFLMEILLITGLGVFILNPEDLPRFMRMLARLIIWVRKWRETLSQQVDEWVRDVEVEDFKEASYKLYEENVKKALGRNKK